MDYIQLINKYIKNDLCKTVYLIHVTAVTTKALKIAQKFELSPAQLKFIEEAAMLHDIGIIKVDDPEIGCFGELDYIAHGVEGGKILREEGYPDHARVAETHTGVGITKEDVVNQKLPIPIADYVPGTLEEKIISYADLFYSKNTERLLEHKNIDQVRNGIIRYGEDKGKIFDEWVEMFE